MRATIHHGDNRTCPSITLEGATHCPGHTVEVPESMDEAWSSVLLLAVEFGYRAAERGENLQKAIEDAKKMLFES